MAPPSKRRKLQQETGAPNLRRVPKMLLQEEDREADAEMGLIS